MGGLITSADQLITSTDYIVYFNYSFFSEIKMPKRCSIKGCKTNYDSEIAKNAPKTPVFSLPNAKDEPEAREQWITVIKKVNGDFNITSSTVVCEKHWPVGYSKYSKKGHQRPSDPPTVFGSILPSCLPSPQPKLRKHASRLSLEQRNSRHDELAEFDRKDKVTFES